MGEREELRIGELAAWRYPGRGSRRSGACVVMAHGFSLTRHDGLDGYAEAFAAAGHDVLAFDHRHLGDSGGERRQRFRTSEQLADWRAAIAHARGSSERVVLWGFSFSGGHVATLAASEPELAAAMVLCPFLDGLARVRSSSVRDVAWILPRAIADRAGRHVLVPVTGEPHEHAAMNLPGEAQGFRRAVPEGSPWRNQISPGVFLTVATHRPVRHAAKIRIPLWVGLGERDVSVSNRAVERLAQRAPQGELHRYDVDHFEPFVGADAERIAGDQVEWLGRVVG